MGRRGIQLDGVAAVDHFPISYDVNAPTQWQLKQFIECLPLVSGRLYKPNAKLKLEKWQCKFVAGMFPLNGKQKKLGVISIGRKNGKSGLMIAFIAAGLFGPLQQHGGEIIAVASNKEQADQMFRVLISMLKLMPDQLSTLNVENYKRRVTNTANDTVFYVAAHDESLLGRNPSMIIADECGTWKETAAKGKKVWDTLVTSQGARSNPLLLAASTQAATDDHWFSAEVIDYVMKAEKGIVNDDTVCGVVYAGKKDCKLTDRQAWRDANPSLGTILDEDYLVTASQQALLLPSKRNAFRAYHLNQRVTTQQSQWQELFERDLWLACKRDYEYNKNVISHCCVGVDLASTTDLAAISVYCDNGYTFCYPYAAGITALQSKNKSLFETWREMGCLTICDDTIDLRMIVEKLKVIGEQFNVQGVYYDPWQANTLLRLVDEEGLSLPNLTPVPQGYKQLSQPIKFFIEQVMLQKLYWNNPVLSWCVMNARGKTDNNRNFILTKDRSVDKIDACAALINALYGHVSSQPDFMPFLLSV